MLDFKVPEPKAKGSYNFLTMPKIATITSKRQLTIPVSIFRRADLREGQKVLITEKDGRIQIEPAVALVEHLAGSVKIPSRFKGLSPKEMVQRAKKEHFRRS